VDSDAGSKGGIGGVGVGAEIIGKGLLDTAMVASSGAFEPEALDAANSQ
jgi:hypothetical protein